MNHKVSIVDFRGENDTRRSSRAASTSSFKPLGSIHRASSSSLNSCDLPTSMIFSPSETKRLESFLRETNCGTGFIECHSPRRRKNSIVDTLRHHELSEIATRLGNVLLESTLSAPDVAFVHETIGIICSSNGNFSSAADAFTKALWVKTFQCKNSGVEILTTQQRLAEVTVRRDRSSGFPFPN